MVLYTSLSRIHSQTKLLDDERNNWKTLFLIKHRENNLGG